MADYTAFLNGYIPDHAEENWDDDLLKFEGFLKGIDSLFGRSFFMYSPQTDPLDWVIQGPKKGWLERVDEMSLAPTGSEVGNDGWRVLINGAGTASGAFSGHDLEIAVWDDLLTVWEFYPEVKTDGNWVFDLDSELRYYYKNTAWSTPSGVTSFDLDGTAQITSNGWVDVSFAAVQPDTNYKIIATPDSVGSVFVTNKTVNGFRINAQSGAWTGYVDWMLSRKADAYASDKSGTDTIVTNGWVDVTFAVAYVGTDYRVQCTPAMNSAIFVTNKTATGFRINAQSPGVTGDVDWVTKYSI